jgi:hypothetical protein
MQKYKLSNEYTIYKVKYDGDYPKESFIKRINQNKSIINKIKDKNVENIVLIECAEFKSVNDFIVSILEIIENKKINSIAKSSWVYTQKSDFNMIMHKHDYLLYTTEKTKLKTEWTCVFYIQIPKKITNGEGDITFMTEDKKLHTFTPKESDIIIFPGTLYHMVTPIPNAEIDRIVYASNFNFNLNNY